MTDIPQYTSRIVAFIDMLGFKEKIYSLKKDSELLKNIHKAFSYLEDIKKFQDSDELFLFLKSKEAEFRNFEFTTFSDSIVISNVTNNAWLTIFYCGWIQAQLFQFGILTRGGISSGLMVHKDNIMYGKGLLKSIDLESACAIYPRILIDSSLVNTLDEKTKSLLSEDTDGLWFVNPFKAVTTFVDSIIMGKKREVYFSELLRDIEQNITQAKKTNSDKVFAKYNWLKNKAEHAQKEYKNPNN